MAKLGGRGRCGGAGWFGKGQHRRTKTKSERQGNERPGALTDTAKNARLPIGEVHETHGSPALRTSKGVAEDGRNGAPFLQIEAVANLDPLPAMAENEAQVGGAEHFQIEAQPV